MSRVVVPEDDLLECKVQYLCAVAQDSRARGSRGKTDVIVVLYRLPERANGPLCLCAFVWGCCARTRDACNIYRKAMAMEKKLVQLGFITPAPLATITEEDVASQAEAPAVNTRGITLDDQTDAAHAGRQASTRSLAEAGIPSTPNSARARKKRGGRRG